MCLHVFDWLIKRSSQNDVALCFFQRSSQVSTFFYLFVYFARARSSDVPLCWWTGLIQMNEGGVLALGWTRVGLNAALLPASCYQIKNQKAQKVHKENGSRNGSKHAAKTTANGQPPTLNWTADCLLGVSGPSVTIQTWKASFSCHFRFGTFGRERIGWTMGKKLNIRLLKRGKMRSYVTAPFTLNFMAVL